MSCSGCEYAFMRPAFTFNCDCYYTLPFINPLYVKDEYTRHHRVSNNDKRQVHSSQLMVSEKACNLAPHSCQLIILTAVTTCDTESISWLALSTADKNCSQPTDKIHPSFELRPLLHRVSNASHPVFEPQSMNIHIYTNMQQDGWRFLQSLLHRRRSPRPLG